MDEFPYVGGWVSTNPPALIVSVPSTVALPLPKLMPALAATLLSVMDPETDTVPLPEAATVPSLAVNVPLFVSEPPFVSVSVYPLLPSLAVNV